MLNNPAFWIGLVAVLLYWVLVLVVPVPTIMEVLRGIGVGLFTAIAVRLLPRAANSFGKQARYAWQQFQIGLFILSCSVGLLSVWSLIWRDHPYMWANHPIHGFVTYLIICGAAILFVSTRENGGLSFRFWLAAMAGTVVCLITLVMLL